MLAVFLALVALGAVVLLPKYGQFLFVGYVVLLCLLLVAVCWLKGERPRWS